jgi:GTP cyclohydrolase-4
MQETHTAYLGLGANLGDRQSNLTQALQHLRTKVSVEKVSAFYSTKPVGYLDQPDFLNIACQIATDLSPLDLLHFVKQIEKIMGRQASFRNAPRPIDIDILLYKDLALDTPELTIPHPRMRERAFVLAPLAEIAPQAIDPITGLTIQDLLARADQSGVELHSRSLRIPLGRDIQQSTPEVHVGLSRAGVTNLRRIVRITRGGDEHLFYAQIDLFADLNPTQMGVHMSRFGDVLEEIVDEITFEKSPDIETLAERISQQVVTSQKAVRSEVQIRAVYPMEKVAPVSGKQMQELYTLIGISVSNLKNSKHIVGVEVDGMTVCPCAQEMVRDYSKERLLEAGFNQEQIARILEVIPVASHNQRGRGTLMIGTDQEIRAEDLVRIVESSMSSETYDVLKRPDELFVVNKAHHNPRFVEDVVREILFNVVDVYSGLPDSSFVLAKQVNLESIHKHNAFAERYGTLGEIRQEILEGQRLLRQTTLQEWLENYHEL